MDRDPTKTAVRNAKREQRLGSDAACALCGEGAPEVLLVVNDPALAETVRRIVPQRHHVLSRALDPELTILLCRNCHAKATENQLRGLVPMTPQANVLDRLIGCLRGVSAFLHDALNAVERFLAELEEFAGFLDTNYDTWRELWRKRK